MRAQLGRALLEVGLTFVTLSSDAWKMHEGAFHRRSQRDRWSGARARHRPVGGLGEVSCGVCVCVRARTRSQTLACAHTCK